MDTTPATRALTMSQLGYLITFAESDTLHKE